MSGEGVGCSVVLLGGGVGGGHLVIGLGRGWGGFVWGGLVCLWGGVLGRLGGVGEVGLFSVCVCCVFWLLVGGFGVGVGGGGIRTFRLFYNLFPIVFSAIVVSSV